MQIKSKYVYSALIFLMVFCCRLKSSAEELSWGNAEEEKGTVYVYCENCKFELRDENALFLIEGEETNYPYQLPRTISFNYNKTETDMYGKEYSHLVTRTVPIKGIVIDRKLYGSYVIPPNSLITIIEVSNLFSATSDDLHIAIQKKDSPNIKIGHYVSGIEKLFQIYYQSVQYQQLRSYCDSYYPKNRQPEFQFYTGTIQYELNGGENPEGQPSVYVIGQETELKDPTRKDYVFKGWYTTPDFQNQSRMTNIPESQDGMITLYAKWEYSVALIREGVRYLIGADHSVSVQPGDYFGQIVIAEQVSYNGTDYPVTSISPTAFSGSLITMLTIPKSVRKIGKGAFTDCERFTDLYLNSMTMTLGNDFPKTINLHTYADAAAYRSYAAEGYTGSLIPYSSRILYQLNDGVNHPSNPDQYLWNSYLELKEPTRDGYVFAGWYLDASFQQNSRIQVIHEEVYRNIVLYAKWIAVPGHSVTDQTKTFDEGTNKSSTTESSQDSDGTHANSTEQGNFTKETRSDTEIISQGDPTRTGTDETTQEASSMLSSPKTAEIKSVTQYDKPVIESYVIKKTKKNRIMVKAVLVNASGCQMKYSLNKGFKSKKTVTVQLKKNKLTTGKLKKGKTYYIKLRAYRKNGKKKQYGAWTIVTRIKL